jgi:hypothetical protein
LIRGDERVQERRDPICNYLGDDLIGNIRKGDWSKMRERGGIIFFGDKRQKGRVDTPSHSF